MFAQDIMQLFIGYIFGSGSVSLGITSAQPAHERRLGFCSAKGSTDKGVRVHDAVMHYTI